MTSSNSINLSLWAIPPESAGIEPFLVFKNSHKHPDYSGFSDKPSEFPYQGSFARTREYFNLDNSNVNLAINNRQLLRECTFEMRRFVDLDWRTRERQRFDTKQYTPIPKEWQELNINPDHFLHIATMDGSDSTDNDYVAFTENEQKGRIDVQNRMRAGKYIKKFFPEFDNERVRVLASCIQALNGVQMTDDPEMAALIYENGPDSCMKKSPSTWEYSERYHGGKEYQKKACPLATEFPRHPIAAIFAGDLKLAWMGPVERPTARAWVWPEQKLYGRCYGAHTVMKAALEKAGYKDTYQSGNTGRAFCGAKLRTIRLDKDKIVMPYLDGASYLHYKYSDEQIYIGDGQIDDRQIGTGIHKGEKILVFGGGSTSGAQIFRDPNVRYCSISGKEMNKSDDAVQVGRQQEALRSEALKHGYRETIEGVWHTQPYIMCTEDREEVHNPNMWQMPHGVVRDTLEEQTRGGRVRIFRHRRECIQLFGGEYTRKGNKHKLFEHDGKYYHSIENFFSHHPNYYMSRYTLSIQDSDVLKECVKLGDKWIRDTKATAPDGTRLDDMDDCFHRSYKFYRDLVEHFYSQASHNVRDRRAKEAMSKVRNKGNFYAAQAVNTSSDINVELF